jgi:hypothetical protein
MPVLVEQYAVVGDKNDAEKAAEYWRFGPKAFKTYYNIRDPLTIQQRAESELPLEKVYGDWPVSPIRSASSSSTAKKYCPG